MPEETCIQRCQRLPRCTVQCGTASAYHLLEFMSKEEEVYLLRKAEPLLITLVRAPPLDETHTGYQINESPKQKWKTLSSHRWSGVAEHANAKKDAHIYDLALRSTGVFDGSPHKRASHVILNEMSCRLTMTNLMEVDLRTIPSLQRSRSDPTSSFIDSDTFREQRTF
ncbi:hypothetical protein V8B97DRAFT_1919765 [Scleroderma yunnanense]